MAYHLAALRTQTPYSDRPRILVLLPSQHLTCAHVNMYVRPSRFQDEFKHEGVCVHVQVCCSSCACTQASSGLLTSKCMGPSWMHLSLPTSKHAARQVTCTDTSCELFHLHPRMPNQATVLQTEAQRQQLQSSEQSSSAAVDFGLS